MDGVLNILASTPRRVAVYCWVGSVTRPGSGFSRDFAVCLSLVVVPFTSASVLLADLYEKRAPVAQVIQIHRLGARLFHDPERYPGVCSQDPRLIEDILRFVLGDDVEVREDMVSLALEAFKKHSQVRCVGCKGRKLRPGQSRGVSSESRICPTTSAGWVGSESGVLSPTPRVMQRRGPCVANNETLGEAGSAVGWDVRSIESPMERSSLARCYLPHLVSFSRLRRWNPS